MATPLWPLTQPLMVGTTIKGCGKTLLDKIPLKKRNSKAINHKEFLVSRKRNWSEYNRKLVQRGSITFLLDPKVFKPRREKGRMGRPVEFSNQIMLMLMMTKIHFRLPYRKLEGFMRSIMELQGKKHRLPTYSCIAKRAGQLAHYL